MAASSSCDDIDYYLHNHAAWQAIEDDCLNATRSVMMEQYIIADDEAGRGFLSTLAGKARHGISVRLMLDAVGSRGLRDTEAIKELKEAGGQVEFDHELWWVQLLFPPSWFPRNHCKTVVVDEEIAYIGGTCMAEHMRHWRDTQLRFTGSVVPRLHACLMHNWRRLTREETEEDAKYACEELFAADATPFDLVVHDPVDKQHRLERLMIQAIDRAQGDIMIASPYFFPPRRLRWALYRARKRGVRVSLLMSEKSDVELATIMSRALLHYWLRRGFEVLFYQPTVLHAKYAIIGEDWCTVGSNNFDHLSLRFNREANVVSKDAAMHRELKQHFEQDSLQARPATYADWRALTPAQKLVGKLGRWVYGLL